MKDAGELRHVELKVPLRLDDLLVRRDALHRHVERLRGHRGALDDVMVGLLPAARLAAALVP